MNIVVPLTNIDNYEPLIESGADEFYCGFIPHKWLEKYNNSLPLNRREILLNCNICDMSSMRILKKMIDRYQKPVKITFNSHYYLGEQYPLILNIIRDLLDIGYDTFIIADIVLLLHLKQNNIHCKVHLSGETGPVSRLSLGFNDKLFDISRYIFPLKTTLNDMRSVIQNTSSHKEFEAFIVNASCPFSGEYCNTYHCDELAIGCTIPFRAVGTKAHADKYQVIYRNIRHTNLLKNIVNEIHSPNSNSEYVLGETGCGLCRIKDMVDIGVRYFKLNGRGVDLEIIKKNVKYVREAIDRVKCEQNDDYEYSIKKDFFNMVCPERCMYPEALKKQV